MSAENNPNPRVNSGSIKTINTTCKSCKKALTITAPDNLPYSLSLNTLAMMATCNECADRMDAAIRKQEREAAEEQPSI